MNNRHERQIGAQSQGGQEQGLACEIISFRGQGDRPGLNSLLGVFGFHFSPFKAYRLVGAEYFEISARCVILRLCYTTVGFAGDRDGSF